MAQNPIHHWAPLTPPPVVKRAPEYTREDMPPDPLRLLLIQTDQPAEPL